MNCPLCIDQTLDIAHHGGIEIDICPKCRGVWLDRGELEKLAASSSAARPGKPSKHSGTSHLGSSKGAAGKSSKSQKKKKRKKSLGSRLGDVLEEVLDL